MLSLTIALLLQSFAVTLRLSGRTGSFPPPLSPEEETKALLRMRNGDAAARDKLIEHNLRLVAHVIKKFYTTASDQDDLISIGTIGLIKGITTFNPEKHVKLPTYAGKCIQNEIFMYFRVQKRRQGEQSLNDALNTDKDGNPLEYMDIVSDEETPAELLEIVETKKQLRRLLTKLPARERRIIEMRYGFDGGQPLPQREVATLLGISRSYVSRIEKKALEELREHYCRENV
ncbi:MAG: RNA polymerase sporulation sigma factor SigK [Oscillospiraceae bacterium]|nr:RNA polymerase sporulation sigma factor SigK [Oscillospiraceae bacterium]